MRYPGSRFNRHPALRILLGQPIQFWLQYSRTHRYTCYAIYPQVRCNSIWHSRKRLAKVSIFTPVFRLFPLIPVFHPCSKSSYSTGFSRTYAHFNSYYKSKENLFSQIRSIGKSPLSRFSDDPAATSLSSCKNQFTSQSPLNPSCFSTPCPLKTVRQLKTELI